MTLQPRVAVVERPILFRDDMPEEWRSIPGHPGYEASSWGRIRSLSTYRASDYQRVLRAFQRKRGGYHTVSCGKVNGRRVNQLVHRLVAAAFHGPCPEGLQVAHTDGDPSNNRPENLRYVTPAENIADRERHGRTARGSRQGSALLNEERAALIRKLHGVLTADEVGVLAGVSPFTIERLWGGRSWKHA